VHSGSHLDQPLKEVARLRRRRTPDLLPRLVGLEEASAIEEVDPFQEEAPPLFRRKVGMKVSALAGQS
jgi:hypothetical protein